MYMYVYMQYVHYTTRYVDILFASLYQNRSEKLFKLFIENGYCRYAIK